MFDFDMRHPFNTFNHDPAYNGDLNGATVMIMQEDKDYNKANNTLKEYVKSYGLLEDKSEVEYILSIFHQSLDALFPEHQKQLVDDYTR